MSNITDVKSQILSAFDNRLPKKFRKPLALFLRDPLVPREEKLDFLGALSLKDSEYFMETIYPGVPYQFGNMTIQDLIEMDEYMLKKYCFLEGEEIKTTFIGNILDKKTSTSGRIFLTNYRLLACGSQTTRSAQKKVRVGGPSITGMLVRSGITRHRKAIRKAITNAFRKDLTEWNLGEWGYYFPIYKSTYIDRTKKSISYTIDVETEKQKKTLLIRVNPSRLKKQPKEEFQEQREQNLKQVEEILKQYQ